MGWWGGPSRYVVNPTRVELSWAVTIWNVMFNQAEIVNSFITFCFFIAISHIFYTRKDMNSTAHDHRNLPTLSKGRQYAGQIKFLEWAWAPLRLSPKKEMCNYWSEQLGVKSPIGMSEI